MRMPRRTSAPGQCRTRKNGQRQAPAARGRGGRTGPANARIAASVRHQGLQKAPLPPLAAALPRHCHRAADGLYCRQNIAFDLVGPSRRTAYAGAGCALVPGSPRCLFAREPGGRTSALRALPPGCVRVAVSRAGAGGHEQGPGERPGQRLSEAGLWARSSVPGRVRIAVCLFSRLPAVGSASANCGRRSSRPPRPCAPEF